MDSKIDFSVILPVYHGGDFLKRALKSIEGLEFSHDRFEVLFSGPDQDIILSRFFEKELETRSYDCQYIRVQQSNRSALLNAAISKSKGRILVFTDDDCTFPRDWLQSIAAVFERETGICVVGGKDITGPYEPTFNKSLDYVLNSFWGTGGLRRKTSGIGKYYPKLWNMAIPRELAQSLAISQKGGVNQVFNEELDVHEDVELIDRIQKAGNRVIFAPEVQVFHSRDTDLKTFTIRSFNMARTSRNIGVHRLPHILLATFALGIILLVIAATVILQSRPLLSIVSVCYLMILLGNAIGGYKKIGQLAVIYHIPLLLLAIHFSRGLGYLFPWHGKRKSVISCI